MSYLYMKIKVDESNGPSSIRIDQSLNRVTTRSINVNKPELRYHRSDDNVWGMIVIPFHFYLTQGQETNNSKHQRTTRAKNNQGS